MWLICLNTPCPDTNSIFYITLTNSNTSLWFLASKSVKEMSNCQLSTLGLSWDVITYKRKYVESVGVGFVWSSELDLKLHHQRHVPYETFLYQIWACCECDFLSYGNGGSKEMHRGPDPPVWERFPFDPIILSFVHQDKIDLITVLKDKYAQ